LAWARQVKRQSSVWYSHRVEQHIKVVRWGHWGTPVLLFPTAAGDAEEVERFDLIRAVEPLIAEGRIKVYSCDSIAGRAWAADHHSAEHCARLQNRYDDCIYHEVVPAIRADCSSHDIEIITAGASIGAFNAVASLCRHPDAFRVAIGLSGTFDLESFLNGPYNEDFYYCSPMHFLPNLPECETLDRLRQRFVVMAYGQGRWENPDYSWRLAQVLGSRRIPNRVDAWGSEYDHDWPSWREMLPVYLNELA
jgi:esterase/lipase superfamily enzyme